MQIQAGGIALVLTVISFFKSTSSFGITGQQSSSFVSKPALSHVSNNFITPYNRKTRSANSSRRSPRCNLSMFGGGESGGIEELKELTKVGGKGKFIRNNASLLRIGGVAAVPVSAIMGAIMTPSRRMAASAVGSAITGVAGYIGKSRLDVTTESEAMPAIAETIIDLGLESPSLPQYIKDVREKFGVLDDDFNAMCIDVYKKYLVGMVKNPIPKTSEIKELTNLREALRLNNLSVGEAHAAASAEFYRQTCLFTPVEDLADPDHPDRMSIDKFIFLSERAFKQGGETNEAFIYEMSRVAKNFNVTFTTAVERVADVTEPFYKRALKSTRDKLSTDAVSSDMLLRARKSLGIDEMTAADMHMIAFADEIKSMLGKDTGNEDIDPATLKFSSGDRKRLSKLQEVLSIEDREANYELYSEATALFYAKSHVLMSDAITGTISPEKTWKQMKVRQGELLLKDESMKDLVAATVMHALGKPLEETMTFAKVNNEAATYDKLMDVMEAKQVCIAVLKESGWDAVDDFDKEFCDPFEKDSACSFLSPTERLRLFKIMLKRAVLKSESGKELTNEENDKVMEVQGLLGIMDTDRDAEFKRNFGPELQKVLDSSMLEIMGDDYTPELLNNLKALNDKVISDYKLSDDMVTQYRGPVYNRAVGMVSQKSPSGIPSKELMEQLNALRDLLGMTEEDTYDAHLSVFGKSYKTGILEAMGSTGIIRPEFRGPLDDLQSRLGVSDAAAKDLFLGAVKEKMIPMVEWIVLELERTMLTSEQLSRKRKQDFGEDYFKSGKGASGSLGIDAEANIMTDCMNLIDFYTENDIAEQKEVGTKTIEKKVVKSDGEETITEEVPKYETFYPIKALETRAIEKDVAELLYRQFVVKGFTTEGPQGERYEAVRSTFGGILGLPESTMTSVTDSIGKQVYENFIKNAMQKKGALDQQDMMFLVNIKGKLNLSDETSEKMLAETQKKILSEEANAILNNVTAEASKAFREKCNSMGMDLEKDLGISKARLSRLFEAEISPGLASREISTESGDFLTELQESLGLAPEEAEKMFESILDKSAEATITAIQGDLLRGREENCAEYIQRLVHYAKFVNGEFEFSVKEDVAWRVFNLYEAMDFDGVDSEIVDENKALLKTTLGL